MLRLQRTIGNQAVQRLVEANAVHENRSSPAIHRIGGHGAGIQRQEDESGEALASDAETQAEEAMGRETEAQAEETPGGAVPSPIARESTTDAPSATYLVPFDRNPLAAPGERIIFSAEFSDLSPGDYQLEYSTTGGHFTSARGPTTRTIAGLISGNVNFFVPKRWNGRSTVQVVLRVRKRSDRSVAQTETWDFGLKTRFPKTMTQQEGTGERNIPAVYTYDIGPALRRGSPPFYEHQTILERFGNWTLANIRPRDIARAYRRRHGLSSAAAVSRHFLGNYAGSNGTFTVDSNDQIADQHGGHPDLTNLVANLARPKDIEVALPQTYEAKPGKALGRYMVTRVLKADGTTWQVKKRRRR